MNKEVNVFYSNGLLKYQTMPRFQYDHGLVLRIHGQPDTTGTIEAQFTNVKLSTTLNVPGNMIDDYAEFDIPASIMMFSRNALAYVYFTNSTQGRTVLEVEIPIIPRPKPSEFNYTPEQIQGYQQLLDTLNNAIDEVDDLNKNTTNAATTAATSANNANLAATNANNAIAGLEDKISDGIEKRISQITDGITDGSDYAAELVSARTDADGVIHTSLKDRLDNEVSSLKDQIADAQRKIDGAFSWVIGGVSADNGNIRDNENRIRSTIERMVNGSVEASDNVEFWVAYYDETKTFIPSDGEWRKTVIFPHAAPENAAFFRLVARTNPESVLTEIVDSTGDKVSYYSLVVGDIMGKVYDREPIPADNITIAKGAINSSQGINASSSTRCRTRYPLHLHKYATITLPNYAFAVFRYALNGDTYQYDRMLVSLDNARQTVTLLEDGYYRFVFAKFDNSEVSSEDIDAIAGAISVVDVKKHEDIDAFFAFPINELEKGGINASDKPGEETGGSYRLRTSSYYVLAPIKIEWGADAIQYSVIYYDKNFRFTGSDDYSIESRIVSANDKPGAMYARFVFKRTDNAVFTNAEMPKYCSIKASYPAASSNVTRDVPKNIGVLNAILNAKQCREINYVTTAVLPNQAGDYAKDVTVEGLPYSSTRRENLFVPNNVSFHTFMSALTNPNAYLYTEKLDEDPYNMENARTFYGTVCSIFVGYALGLKINHTTIEWFDIDGMELIENQSAYGIELGDTLYETGHVRIVTDITRDTRGRIVSIEVMEAAPPVVRKVNYTASGFDKLLSDRNITIYRYRYIYRTKHTQSPFVAVEDETPMTAPVFDHNVMGRYGDRFNVRHGETVVFDVLNAADYTSAVLYKDGLVYSTTTIPSSAVLEYSGLPYGTYRLCLSDGTNESVGVEFIIVDVNFSVTVTGEKECTMEFSSENSTPVWTAWCDDTCGAKQSEAISADEVAEGRKVSIYQNTRYNSNVFYMKAYFETPFGIVSSQYIPIALGN